MSDITTLAAAQEKLRQYGDGLLALGAWYANRAALKNSLAQKLIASAVLNLIQNEQSEAIRNLQEALRRLDESDSDTDEAFKSIDTLILRKANEG